MHKITGRALPSIAAIQTEAARIEAMIAAATQQIESSDAHLRTAMHLQVCRAELHAYLAGLLYSMGYTNLLERQSVGSEFGFSNVQIENVEDPFKPAGEEDGPRYMECFEC